MEAFRNFWAKLKNAYKSWTVWFGALVTVYGGIGPLLEMFQVNWLPLLKPALGTHYSFVTSAIGLVVIFLRFKTIKSLADK